MADRCTYCGMRVGQCDCQDTHLPAVVERVEELEEKVEDLEGELKSANEKILELESRMQESLGGIAKTSAPFEKIGCAAPLGPKGTP